MDTDEDVYIRIWCQKDRLSEEEKRLWKYRGEGNVSVKKSAVIPRTYLYRQQCEGGIQCKLCHA